jgi:hypothetical protein
MKLENIYPLPTLSTLAAQESCLPSVDDKAAIQDIATGWLSNFSELLQSPTEHHFTSLLDHFVEQCYWRDVLALTWNLRTFSGKEQIRQFLLCRVFLAGEQIHKVQLAHQEHATLERLAPDLAWIQFFLTFETGDIGRCSGVIRLVPIPKTTSTGNNESFSNTSLEWKAYTVFTHLEDLVHHPEQIGRLRPGGESSTEGYQWLVNRAAAVERFETENPTVLVAGGGQSGLTVAARLKTLGVDYLVVDQAERLGGNWRMRYDALCTHTPFCKHPQTTTC